MMRRADFISLSSVLFLGFSLISGFGFSGCGGAGKHLASSGDDGGDRNPTSPQVLDGFYAAQLAKLKDDPETAYEALSKALETDPEAAGLLFELGRMDQDFGRVEAAWDRFEVAIKLEPENRWFRQALAELALEIGQYKTAIEHFEWILDHAPHDQTVYELLIDAYAARRDIDGVLETIDRVERVFGADPYWTQLRLETQKMFGKELDFREIYEAQHAENPADIEMLFQLLGFYESQGLIVELEATLDRAMVRCPTCGAYQMLKAIHVINTGHLTEAHVLLLNGLSHLGDDDPVDAVHISELWINTARPLPALDGLHLVLIEALIEALPGEARPHFLKGKHYVQHELYSEAADAFLACAALAEDQPESLGIAVELLLESGRVTEAIAAAEEGMLLFPMLPRFHLGLAQAHSELGHFEQVVQACQSGWPLVIDDENMHRRYGELKARALLSLARHEEAWRAYERLVLLVPNSPWVQNNYAYELAIHGERLDRALELVEFASTQIPGDAAIEDTYAWVLYKRGAFAEAQVWVDLATTHDLEKRGRVGSALLEHAGDIYLALGQAAEAEAFWQRALEAGGEVERLTAKIASARD